MAMAIIIVCLQQQFVRECGYIIVMGEANESDIAKSTHHVTCLFCTLTHDIQILKRHEKEMCEKNIA